MHVLFVGVNSFSTEHRKGVWQSLFPVPGSPGELALD